MSYAIMSSQVYCNNSGSDHTTHYTVIAIIFVPDTPHIYWMKKLKVFLDPLCKSAGVDMSMCFCISNL